MKTFPWWGIPIVGFVLTALVSGAIFFFLIRKQQEEIKNLQGKIQQQESTIAQRQQAEKDLKEAKKKAQQVRERWRNIGKEVAILRFPDPDDAAMVWEAGIDFQRETRGFFERDLRKFLSELANQCEVDLSYPSIPQFQLTSLQMPTPPQNGYFRWGQMTLTVDGRFANILKFIERLPSFSRPIVVQSPQFQLLIGSKIRATIPIEVYALVEDQVARMIMEGKTPPPTAMAAPTGGMPGAAGMPEAMGMPGAAGMPGAMGMPGAAGMPGQALPPGATPGELAGPEAMGGMEAPPGAGPMEER